MSASGRLQLTLALDRYDRHVPFFDGTVKLSPKAEWQVLQVGEINRLRDGSDRHARMLNGEFDVCEFSLSTYLMARARGAPIIGIPVFPRRLFSASQMYVHRDAEFRHPRDLLGKRVALNSFQTTLSVLAKGDLKFEYGVPWTGVRWLVAADETVPFKSKPGVHIERIDKREDLGAMLERGALDAFFMPRPPRSVASGEKPVRRLFRDPRAEERRYLAKYGYFPIMHVLVIREDLLTREPWLAEALMDSFAQAKTLCAVCYEDPGWSTLAWSRHYVEEERSVFSGDPWPIGFQANRANLERFIEYSSDQNLLESHIEAGSLFPEPLLAT